MDTRRSRGPGARSAATFAGALALALGPVLALTGQGAEPQLLAVFPLGVSRVDSVELTLSGSELKDVQRLFFSIAGLAAERQASGRFAVRVAGDDPRERDGEVWAVTSTGLSNPRRIAVSTLPQVVEHEKNDEPGTAQAVNLPVIIDGTINPATDRDDFRFEVAAGQRTSIAFRSESLGGSVRPALTVFAPDGRELTHDSGGHAEPTLDFRANEPGAYRVRIEDRSYQRTAASNYRLALFTGPRLVAAFPSVLTRGKSQPVTLYGYELPGAGPAGPGFPPGLMQVAVTIDAPSAGDPDGGGWTLLSAAMLDGFRYEYPEVRGSLRIGLVDQEVTREAEGRHDVREKAQEMVVGGVIAGRFLRPGEVDWYRFSARKGQTLAIEAVGERAGPAMDLDLAIHDAQGIPVLTLADGAPARRGAAADPLDTLDPVGAWTVPADGEYSVVIRDLYGPSVWGVDRTYWLAIGPQHEAARVIARSAHTPPHGFSLKPGGKVPLALMAVRRGGHKAPITIHAEDLPTGLEAEPATIKANEQATTLTLTATSDAPAWVGLLTLRAETTLDGEHHSIPVLGATQAHEGNPPVDRLCDGIAAAVIAPAQR